MKILNTIILLLISFATLSQELMFTFEDMNNPQLIEIADEGEMWVGYDHSKTQYLVFTRDFTLRASFPLQFDADDDIMYQIEIVKYMQDDSDELFVAYTLFDDSAPDPNQTLFKMADESGSVLVVWAHVEEFYWGIIGNNEAQIVLDDRIFDHSILFKQAELDNHINHPYKKLRFDVQNNQLSYYGFDNDNNLHKWDEQFNAIWTHNVGLSTGESINEIVRFSRYEFDADDELEWYIKTREFVNFNLISRDIIFNEDGETLYIVEDGYTQLYMYTNMDTEDHLVSRQGQQNTIYKLPGLVQLGTIDAQYLNHARLSIDEYGWLGIDSPSATEANSHLYLVSDSTLTFLQSFTIITDMDNILPTILSVSRDFFDDDPGYEIVYSSFIIDNSDPDFGYNISFVDDDYEPFFKQRGNSIRLDYGTCGEYNGFILRETSSSSILQAQYYHYRQLKHEISSFAEGDKVQYFPNPSTDLVELQWENGYDTIDLLEMYDSSGRLVLDNWNYRCTKNVAYINIAQLAAGEYLLKVSTRSKTETVRLLKQ